MALIWRKGGYDANCPDIPLIPAKAGIQPVVASLDSRVFSKMSGNDKGFRAGELAVRYSTILRAPW